MTHDAAWANHAALLHCGVCYRTNRLRAAIIASERRLRSSAAIRGEPIAKARFFAPKFAIARCVVPLVVPCAVDEQSHVTSSTQRSVRRICHFQSNSCRDLSVRVTPRPIIIHSSDHCIVHFRLFPHCRSQAGILHVDFL